MYCKDNIKKLINFYEIYEKNILIDGKEKFLLKFSSKLDKPTLQFIVEQFEAKRKAKKKLPKFYNSSCILTPLCVEQATSEAVALFKSKHFKGKSILSLASGIGIDDWAFSQNFEKVISVELNQKIHEYALYNNEIFDKKNIQRINSSAEDFLKKNHQIFDIIYTDPDRRNEDNKKQFLLSQHSPNIIELLPEIEKITNTLIIKCSPIYDIHLACNELPQLSEIWCLNFEGENKELILKIDFDKQVNDVLKRCFIIKDENNWIELNSAFSRNVNCENTNEIKGYLYDFNSSLIKMEMMHEMAKLNNLKAINYLTPFFIGRENFDFEFAKTYKIIDSFKYNLKSLKAYLNEKNITQINIKVRNSKVDSKKLFKDLKIKEGGEQMLFVTEFEGQNFVIYCSLNITNNESIGLIK